MGGGAQGGTGGGAGNAGPFLTFFNLAGPTVIMPPPSRLKKALHYREGAYIQPDTCQIMPIYINLQFSHSISQY